MAITEQQFYNIKFGMMRKVGYLNSKEKESVLHVGDFQLRGNFLMYWLTVLSFSVPGLKVKPL